MDESSLLTGYKSFKNLSCVVPNFVERKTSLCVLHYFIQWIVKQLEYYTEVVFEYKVILHLNEVLLLEFRFITIKFLQNLYLYHSLQNEFLFVF